MGGERYTKMGAELKNKKLGDLYKKEALITVWETTVIGLYYWFSMGFYFSIIIIVFNFLGEFFGALEIRITENMNNIKLLDYHIIVDNNL